MQIFEFFNFVKFEMSKFQIAIPSVSCPGGAYGIFLSFFSFSRRSLVICDLNAALLGCKRRLEIAMKKSLDLRGETERKG
jgi:hypothetical protein